MRKGSRGSALLVSLWATATLAALAIAQATRVSLESKWAGRLQESRQAAALAWAGLEMASQRLAADSQPNWDAQREDWGQVPVEAIPFPPGSFNYRITDEQARIPLNFFVEGAEAAAARARQVDLLAGLPGFTRRTAEEFVARRWDEKKPVMHLGELRRFSGFNPGQDNERMEQLELLVTVHGGTVNLNTASRDVLDALGLSSALIDRIVEFRTVESGVFESAQIRTRLTGWATTEPERTRITQLTGTPPMLVGNSSFFRVELEGRTSRHKILRKARAVVQRTGQIVKIKEWHEFR